MILEASFEHSSHPFVVFASRHLSVALQKHESAQTQICPRSRVKPIMLARSHMILNTGHTILSIRYAIRALGADTVSLA